MKFQMIINFEAEDMNDAEDFCSMCDSDGIDMANEALSDVISNFEEFGPLSLKD